MTAGELAAILTAAAGFLTAVAGILHSMQTRRAVTAQIHAQSREPRDTGRR